MHSARVLKYATKSSSTAQDDAEMKENACFVIRSAVCVLLNLSESSFLAYSVTIDYFKSAGAHDSSCASTDPATRPP